MSYDRLNKSKRFRNLTSVVGVVLMAAIFATAILTERSLSRLADSRELVTHALFVDKTIRDMMSQMLDAETGQRGYLLSGRAPYLQPYYTALAKMRQSRTALGSALSHEPSALEQLNVLDKAIAAKLQDLEHTVSLKSEGRSDEGVELILTDTANQTMNAVREALRGLETNQILRTNQQMAEEKSETTI
jgi:CHASE3 domain sensor protein